MSMSNLCCQLSPLDYWWRIDVLFQQMSGGEKEVDKMDDELSRREMEREYRQILDGGYVRNIIQHMCILIPYICLA